MTSPDLLQWLHMIPQISVAELKELRANHADHLLIDVREHDEYDAGHIEGSVLIPKDTITEKIGEVAPDKNQLIVLHCAAGRRSDLCADTLLGMGYKNVKSLTGGYTAWSQQA